MPEDGPAATDVPVRDASTVVLLRDSADGLQVWLLTRAQQMVFAAGMAVFPGGRVDPADADLPFTTGTDAIAARFGCDATQARALAGAAVRETFEETGVLLTVPTADLSESRTEVEAGTVAFGDLLRSHEIAADGAALFPWARWVTPPGEVRRYDTHFFVAALPEGAQAQDVTSESSSAGWFGVGAALESAQRGELGMLPPTIMTMSGLAKFATVAEVLQAASMQPLAPISPDVTRGADGAFVAALPDGTTFTLPAALFGRP